jgi:hypothetical protein
VEVAGIEPVTKSRLQTVPQGMRKVGVCVLAAAHSGISILGVHPLPFELSPGRHRPIGVVAAHMFDVSLVRRLVGQLPQVPEHAA